MKTCDIFRVTILAIFNLFKWLAVDLLVLDTRIIIDVASGISRYFLQGH